MAEAIFFLLLILFTMIPVVIIAAIATAIYVMVEAWIKYTIKGLKERKK
jgi:hypothetical protein